jgi:hypothetical protein
VCWRGLFIWENKPCSQTDFNYSREMLKPLFSSLMAAVVLIALGGTSRAQTIVNPDFADPTLAPGVFTAYGGAPNTIPGWTNPNIAGVENFWGTGAFTYVPGQTTGVANAAFDDGGTIAQDLTGAGSTLALGTYTLTVEVGNRIGKPWPGGSFGLYTASGALLDSVALTEPASGTFTPETLILPVLTSPYLGDQLQVELISNGNSTTFSDVTLDFVAVPEPSTYAMMLGGLVLLACAIRRRSLRSSHFSRLIHS